MDKEKEVEVVDFIETDVDSREIEVDFENVEDLKILCKIRENLNGKMMTKERPSGKVVIPYRGRTSSYRGRTSSSNQLLPCCHDFFL